MKWPFKILYTQQYMIILAIPCLRAEMPYYGMQACDLKTKKILTHER